MPAKRARRRLAPDDRRQELKRAGLAVFVRKGFGASTVDDIVRAADAAKGTFYLYFKSKKALFAELLDDFAATILHSFRTLDLKPVPVDPIEPDQLKATVVELLTEAYRKFFATCSRQKPLARLFLQETLVDPELNAGRQAIYDSFADLARRSLDVGINLKVLRPMNSRIVAHAIVGMIERVAVQYLITEDVQDFEPLVHELARFEAFGIWQERPPGNPAGR